MKREKRAGKTNRANLQRTLVAAFLILALVGCQPDGPTIATGRFLGSFRGFVVDPNGMTLGLQVDSRLDSLEAHQYTFVGSAVLAGTAYLLEGSERAANERLTYQTLPPPAGIVEARLLDEGGATAYHFELYLLYPCVEFSGCDTDMNGTIYQGDETFGSLHLERYL